jgi:hypothetical protein
MKDCAVHSDQMEDAKLMQAGYAQCAFIVFQSVAFPELGVLGALVAAQCALMPWILPIVRTAPAAAIALSLTSALLSPVFSLLCQQAVTGIKGILGA